MKGPFFQNTCNFEFDVQKSDLVPFFPGVSIVRTLIRLSIWLRLGYWFTLSSTDLGEAYICISGWHCSALIRGKDADGAAYQRGGIISFYSNDGSLVDGRSFSARLESFLRAPTMTFVDSQCTGVVSPPGTCKSNCPLDPRPVKLSRVLSRFLVPQFAISRGSTV